MQIQNFKIEELISYEKNSRTHSEKQVQQIADSIKEFGFTNPVLVDENNVLIAGHGRTLAAQKLGLESVPGIRLGSLSENQKKALPIADNQLALNAGWDLDLLAQELRELNLDDFDMNLIGFDDSFLDELLDPNYFNTLDEDEASDYPPTRTASESSLRTWRLLDFRRTSITMRRLNQHRCSRKAV